MSTIECPDLRRTTLEQAFDDLSWAMQRFNVTMSARGEVMSTWSLFARAWANCLIFRRARLEDLEQLRELQARCFAPGLHDDESQIKECIASDIVAVAEVNSRIVGAAIATARSTVPGAGTWHLYAVEVSPGQQRRGLATALVQQIFLRLPPNCMAMTVTPVTAQGSQFVARWYPRLVPTEGAR